MMFALAGDLFARADDVLAAVVALAAGLDENLNRLFGLYVPHVWVDLDMNPLTNIVVANV
jgi:hypothetical protein